MMIYADNAATTKMSRTAIDAMLSCLEEEYGNPSSLYALGQRARERLEEAREDLDSIAALPGMKLLLRGNHDYWWSSIGRVRRMLADNMLALQNDSVLINGRLYAGSRGWTLPGPEFTEDDQRIYNRERLRLEMSLQSARRRDTQAPSTVMMH
jgi:predicted phosphohydrolase